MIRIFSGALCLIAIGLAAGAVGLFAYTLLADQGFVPSAEVGLLAAGIAGAGYAAAQLAYLAFLRVFYPTRDAAPYLLEAAAQAPALLLLPYALNQESILPHPMLQAFAPLVLGGGFIAAHGTLKFISFFAFISGRPAARWPSIFYIAGAAATGYAALAGTGQWLEQFEDMRPQVEASVLPMQAGFVHASARMVPEGVPFEFPVALDDDQVIDLRWAMPLDETARSVWVTIRLYGDERRRIARQIPVRPDGWTTMRVPLADIPPNTTRVSVVWGIDSEPPWMRFIEFRPIPSGSRQLMLSGPLFHRVRAPSAPPNIVIIAVDGLGGGQVSHLAGNRETTPQLDAFAFRQARFERAYTPAPDATAAAWSLLTGVHPAHHGMYGRTGYADAFAQIPLAVRLLEAGYATAAFTEAEAPDERRRLLTPDTPFRAGFELFDTTFTTVGSGEEGAPVGAQATLDALRRFIDLHDSVRFFAFVRLREMADLQYRARYGGQFIDDSDNPATRDVLDSAASYLDSILGEFLQEITAGPLRRNTIVVVCGLYGFDFNNEGRALIGVSEASLHVPLVLFLPGQARLARRDPVSLEDVKPTLLQLAGLTPTAGMDGLPLLPDPHDRPAKSIQREPLAFSMRTPRWRFSWMPEQEGRDEWLALYDMDRTPPQDRARFNPAIVSSFKPSLETLYARHLQSTAREMAAE